MSARARKLLRVLLDLHSSDMPMTDEITQTEQTPPANGGPRHAGAAFLVVVHGGQTGEMFPVANGPTVLGRGVSADIRLADDGVSRRHAVLLLDGDSVTLRDLGSANGTFCNGSRICERVQLADGDKISLGSAILKFTYQDELDEEFNRRLYESAVKDALTGVYNRRYFDERLHTEMTFAIRHQAPLALMLADIDHFKRINDERGHQVGDATLREIARRLSLVLRAEDVVARYGGEEFAILCRNTGEQQAAALADRLRLVSADELCLADGHSVGVTISIGIAVAPGKGIDTEADLVRASDVALYQAKQRGRNCRVVFDGGALAAKQTG
jgi:two-component system, cell cycle response regulator